MTAALSDFPPTGGWTTDDLDSFPEDGLRRELLDGALLVSPAPTNIHQIIAMRLGVALEETCPDNFEVTQGNEVRISARRTFIPDVLVTTDAAASRRGRFYDPHEVVLAIEIVSPTSQSMDRVMKPALYARAGIPFYWLVETENRTLTVQAYELDIEDEVYQPSGTFTEAIKIGNPWRIDIPLDRLRPRHL